MLAIGVQEEEGEVPMECRNISGSAVWARTSSIEMRSLQIYKRSCVDGRSRNHCAVFKHTVTSGSCSFHSVLTSQSGPPFWSASQKSAGPFCDARLQAWLYNKVGPSGSVFCLCCCKDPEGRGWAGWEAMTLWGRGFWFKVRRSKWWDLDPSAVVLLGFGYEPSATFSVLWCTMRYLQLPGPRQQAYD